MCESEGGGRLGESKSAETLMGMCSVRVWGDMLAKGSGHKDDQ